jgi:hypothetical protein
MIEPPHRTHRVAHREALVVRGLTSPPQFPHNLISTLIPAPARRLLDDDIPHHTPPPHTDANPTSPGPISSLARDALATTHPVPTRHLSRTLAGCACCFGWLIRHAWPPLRARFSFFLQVRCPCRSTGDGRPFGDQGGWDHPGAFCLSVLEQTLSDPGR